MNLYINTDHQWSGTQADAKALGKKFEHVDVPIDKAGLIDFLNGRMSAPRPSTAIFPTEVKPIKVVELDGACVVNGEGELWSLSEVVHGCKGLDLNLLSTALGVLLNEVWSKQEAIELAAEERSK